MDTDTNRYGDADGHGDAERVVARAGYYRAAAIRHGVPDLWLEDAIQDITLRVWRADPRWWRITTRRAAVDAARRYGDRTRVGHTRRADVSLEVLVASGWDQQAPEPAPERGRWLRCPECGREVFTTKAARRYCRKRCQDRAWRRRRRAKGAR